MTHRIPKLDAAALKKRVRITALAAAIILLPAIAIYTFVDRNELWLAGAVVLGVPMVLWLLFPVIRSAGGAKGIIVENPRERR